MHSTCTNTLSNPSRVCRVNIHTHAWTARDATATTFPARCLLETYRNMWSEWREHIISHCIPPVIRIVCVPHMHHFYIYTVICISICTMHYTFISQMNEWPLFCEWTLCVSRTRACVCPLARTGAETVLVYSTCTQYNMTTHTHTQSYGYAWHIGVYKLRCGYKQKIRAIECAAWAAKRAFALRELNAAQGSGLWWWCSRSSEKSNWFPACTRHRCVVAAKASVCPPGAKLIGCVVGWSDDHLCELRDVLRVRHIQ